STGSRNHTVLKNNVLAAVERWGGNGFGQAGNLYGEELPAHTGSQPKGVPYKKDKVDNSEDIQNWFLVNNAFLSTWQAAGIDASIFDVGTPKVTPQASSILLSGAEFAGLSGFENVEFRGAFGTEDWTQGWAEFNPNVKDYLK